MSDDGDVAMMVVMVMYMDMTFLLVISNSSVEGSVRVWGCIECTTKA